MADSIFHRDFKAMPWWWEWWHPTNELSQDPPLKTDVLVVGAGYGGLSTGLELARSGIDVTVLERGDFGVGASTRNGGGVSGGTTMGKGFSGKGVGGDPEAWKKVMARMLADAADSLTQVETVIQREGIDCHWRMNGRFSGAYTPRHYKEQEAKVGTYNEKALGTYMIPREQQREEIASDYYYGGMVVERTGQLHPALYYGGLLKAAHRAGA
ncbi:MAG: FAD-dependent oxidoreductase, partial [Reyranella sp.]|nr:FAD-dependent oxidoreductase [Reyranella sp.]